MITKPYTKLHLFGIGLLAGILYFDLLEYRKLDSFNRKTKYPKIHFLSTNVKFAKLIMLTGVAFVVTNFFVTYKPGIDAYIWSKGANTAYFILSRVTFTLGWFMIAFYIIFGHSKLGRENLGNSGFNAVGKLVYFAYLASPIIMMIVYSNDERGVFMTFIGNTYLGIGHLLVVFVIGVVVYMFFEWQIKRAC